MSTLPAGVLSVGQALDLLFRLGAMSVERWWCYSDLMRRDVKKACVTASARVWYLEPKWLRCKIRTCMCLYQEPGMCHVPMGPPQLPERNKLDEEKYLPVCNTLCPVHMWTRQEGRERGGGGGGGGREREGRETLFLSPSSLLSNLSSPLSSLSSLLSLSPLPLLSPPL